MSSLLSEIHFWTTQEDVVTKHSYYGAFKYYSKKEPIDPSTKKVYCEQRGVLWNPVNRRQNKLKDKLRELEDNLIQNKIINYKWKENNLQLLLSTGLLVFITINDQTGDVMNISLDKQLSAKLQVNIICDGMILGPQVICICNDGHVLGYGASWKDGWLLEGGPRRRIHTHGDWLVVWGRPGSEHPQPWSPLTKDYQRANLHLYWLGIRGPELLAYKNTDGEPFIIVVSKFFEQTLISVEQKVTQRGAVSVEVSCLELSGNSLKTVSITAVPLQTQVSCCELSANETFLLICCIDSTLALLDRNRGSTKTVKASFIPTLCTWQISSALVAICNEKGQFQYYDVALNCVKSQIISEDDTPSPLLDLTGYFHSQVSIVSLNWHHAHLLVALEQGPIICVTHIPKSLSFTSLANRYINMCEVKKAIALLLSWHVNEDSVFVLQRIVSYLLKKPMTDEIAHQLQDALGCYHASAIPLSAEVRNQYGNQVIAMTRRFFHQLVRAEMYETAFLLAVDVVHHDLFMDLHFVAVKIGETEMAAAARAQASALMSRCSSETSNCSHSSCSECSIPCENDSNERSNIKPSSNVTLSSIDIANDNLQTTNFNQPEMSKNPDVTSSLHDLPKLNPPRVNYVKPPKVPSNFLKPNAVTVPPLPFNFTVPNLLNNNLGIPFSGSNDSQNIPMPFYPSNYAKHSHLLQNQKQFSTPQTNFGVNNNLATSTKSAFVGGNHVFNLNETSHPTKYIGKAVQSTKYGKNIETIDLDENSHSNFKNSDQVISIGDQISSNFNVRVSTINFGVTATNPGNNARNTQPNTFMGSQSNFIWNTKPKLEVFSSDDRSNPLQNLQRSSFVPNKSIFVPPPLPITKSSNNIAPKYSISNVSHCPPAVPKVQTVSTSFSCASPMTSSKKPQSKVKFSDTVTAFIVPEVKRPVRPAPPPHVTDPQKELADSLPLCHPNEDYLKDFAPIKQNESGVENRDPPKIKVVHFGVV